jgi:transketolase
MRDRFIDTTTSLLDSDPRTALVLADISAASFAGSARRHPDRVVNVGIREQLMIGVAGGMALTGLRPIVHSYATFLVDRAYEQIKLDLSHQDVGAVLVSVGASYDASSEGRTHQSPADVALFDTLPGWTVHVPGHEDEAERLLRAAAGTDAPVYIRLSTQRNDDPHHTDGELRVIHEAAGAGAPVIVAVGPMLKPVLHAITGLDVTVAYTNTPRPFDAAGLAAMTSAVTRRAAVRDVILVEPYLAGTSAREVASALSAVPHRLLALGVRRADLRRYGSPRDHARWHGLDAAGLRRSITEFLAA